MEKDPKNKLITKFRINYYSKMSSEDFDGFCARLLQLHTTGVYIPPPPKPYVCNKKMRTAKGPRKYVSEEKKRSTMFGKGRVGVSCESYGVRNCSCCRPENNGARFINDAGNRVNSAFSDTFSQVISKYSLRSEPRPEHYNEEIVIHSNSSNDSEEIFIHSNSSNDSVLCMDESVLCMDDAPTVPSTSNKKTKIIDEIVLSDDNYDNDKENVKLTTWISKKEKYVAKNSDLKRKSAQLLQSLMEKYGEGDPKQKKIIQVPVEPTVVPMVQEKGKPSHGAELVCPICFESLKNLEVMTTLCGHIYCSPCIQAAIKTTKCCPTCRTKLSLKSIHPIFI